jgi:hypothetical protein
MVVCLFTFRIAVKRAFDADLFDEFETERNVFLYSSLEKESTMSVICFIRLLASGWEVKCPWFNQITKILKAHDQAIKMGGPLLCFLLCFKILFYWKMYVQLSIIIMNFDIFRTLSWIFSILSCYKWEKEIRFKCFVINCNSLFQITIFK